MFEKCFNELSKTIDGKPLLESEKKRMQAAFTQSFLKAAEDGSLSEMDTLARAVEMYRKEAKIAADLSNYQKVMQAYAIERGEAFVAQSNFRTKSDAVTRMIALNFDQKSGIESVEALATGINSGAGIELRKVLNFIGTKGLGYIENAKNAELVIREMHGEDTGNAEAKAAAKTWLDLAETMRQRFVAAGGKLANLDNWIMPQGWSIRATTNGWKRHPDAATFKTNEQRIQGSREMFVSDMLRVADRAKYIDYETGMPMDDTQLVAHLSASFNTIVTDGIGKSSGAAGASSRIANRDAAHRQIHIKGADGWLEMSQLYGASPVQSAMESHVRRMATNIALIEKLGSDPAGTVKHLTDAAKAEAASTGSMLKAGFENKDAWLANTTLEYIAQQSDRLEPQGMAKALKGLNNLQIIKLGAALISNFTDLGMMHFMNAATGGSPIGLMFQQMRGLNPANVEHRAQLEAMGLFAETMSNKLYRHSGDVMESGWTSAVGDATMRASLLSKFTEWNHEAYASNMSNTLGKAVASADSMANLHGADKKIFEGYGFNDTDFALLKLAKPDNLGTFASTMLSAKSVQGLTDAQIAMHTTDAPDVVRQALQDKLLGAIHSETQMGVLRPSATTKALLTGGFQKGTFKGVVFEGMMMFKSFPVAMLLQHMQRTKSFEGSGQLFYFAGMLTTATLFGAVSVQIGELLSLRNMRDMNDGQFWLKAAMKGGGLSIYADAFMASQQSFGGGVADYLAGPALSDVNAMSKAVGGSLKEISVEDPNYDKVTMNFAKVARDKIPVAKLWYTKGLFDHMITQQLQEAANPGYIARMEDRAMTEFHQTPWWSGNDTMPKGFKPGEAWQGGY